MNLVISFPKKEEDILNTDQLKERFPNEQAWEMFLSPYYGRMSVTAPIVHVIKLIPSVAKVVGQDFMNVHSVNINSR